MLTVWVRKTRKTTKCYHCNRDVEVGTYQIVCQYYMKVANGKTWWKRMVFHSGYGGGKNCWLDRAVAEIELHPPIETRGRKRGVISDENRVIRVKLLRRHAAVMQRLRVEMESNSVVGVRVAHLTESLERLGQEIEQYGGKPVGW